MKKLATLFLLIISFWGRSSNAQGTICNAAFNVTYINGNTLQFNPVITAGLPSTQHYWHFGDGGVSQAVSPAHTYLSGSVFTVVHYVIKSDSIGTVICMDSAYSTVQVQTSPPICNLVANFYSYQDSTATNTHTYQFVNTTVPLHSTDSIRWTFGDGTASNQVNPVHTYTNVGPNTLSYTVCLRVQQRDSTGALTNCISEICHVVVVNNPITCNLTASFYSYQDSTATNTHSYQFVNTTVPLHNTDSIRWTFGDGTASNQLNPNHTYAQAGTYTVCLRVQQRDSLGVLLNCVSEICHQVVVTPGTTCTLIANFYASQDTTSGSINTFHFINTSAPLNAYDSVRWTFGDGTSSNQLNPNHTYAQAGTYTVCLRVQKRGPNGVGLTNCISEICHVVTVTYVCNLHANFSWHADSLNNRKIYFTNLTNPVSTAATILWNLGDGTTSTAWNPVHVYAQPGTYQVCLYVQLTPTCTSYYCSFITVLPTVNCQQQSNFNFTTASTNSQLFNFTPLSVNNNAQYTWTFGDGTGSHSITASHVYTQPGNYTACLTVYQNANCASTTCRPVQVMQQINCDSVHVSYNYYTDSLVPNKVYFHTVSNYSVIHETWTITNINTGLVTTLSQYNPVHVFTDTGYYHVCLRAETSGGCIKEYCQYIYIAHVSSTNICNLQPYPNPGTNTISVNVALNLPEMIHVYVYNSMNLLVKEKHTDS